MPAATSEAIELDFAAARQWYRNRIMTAHGVGGPHATVTFERDVADLKSSGEARVDHFFDKHRRLFASLLSGGGQRSSPTGGGGGGGGGTVDESTFVRRSPDRATCTISLAFFRLIVHSEQAPDMSSPTATGAGSRLMNVGRAYDVAFFRNWVANVGPLTCPPLGADGPSGGSETKAANETLPSSSPLSSPPTSTLTPTVTKPSSVAVPVAAEDATTTAATTANACRLCGTLSTARCGRCRRVYYCSPAHQSSDWASHKAACARS